MAFVKRRAFIAAGAALLARPAWASQAVLRIGDQKGGAQPLMEAAGVLSGISYRLEWSQFAGAPMLMEALNADAIDAGGIGDAPFVSGVASAIRMKAVSATKSNGAVTALVVAAGSPVHAVADLKGRSIATLKGQTGHFLVLAALQRAGMRRDDVQFVFLAPSEAKAALVGGRVDGWATWGPYIAMAKVQDGAREVVNGDGLMSGQSYTVASDQAIAEKRAALSDFLRRLRLARSWGLTHQEAQARIWAEQTGFPFDVGKIVVETARTETVRINPEVIAAQQNVADFFREAQVIPQKQNASDSFDNSFNEQIFAS